MKSTVEIASDVAEKHGITKKLAKEVLDTAFDSIVAALKVNDTVNIHEFGRISIKHSEPRVGRNPRTGAVVNIPAKRKAVFLPAAGLKATLNG